MRLLRSIVRRLRPPSETLEGYEQAELIEVIFQKTKAYTPAGEWPEVRGALTALDFGGGCGLHYKLAKSVSPNIRWAVVETPAMVERASELATDRLRFFSSIAEAKDWLGLVGIMHSNGAIQCVPDPEKTLAELCGIRASKMLWYRVSLSSGEIEKTTHTSHLIDHGPGAPPDGLKDKYVKFPFTKIPERVFMEAHRGYDLKGRGEDWFRFSLANPPGNENAVGVHRADGKSRRTSQIDGGGA